MVRGGDVRPRDQDAAGPAGCAARTRRPRRRLRPANPHVRCAHPVPQCAHPVPSRPPTRRTGARPELLPSQLHGQVRHRHLQGRDGLARGDDARESRRRLPRRGTRSRCRAAARDALQWGNDHRRRVPQHPGDILALPAVRVVVDLLLRAATSGVDRVGVGASPQERSHGARGVLPGGVVQRRAPVGCRRVRVRAVCEQGLNDVHVVLRGCPVEGRGAVIASLVHGRAVLQQLDRLRGVAPGNSRVKDVPQAHYGGHGEVLLGRCLLIPPAVPTAPALGKSGS